MENISWSDFEKIKLRIGTVVKVEDFPKARNPSYILHVDFGEEIGIKKSSAQITVHYTKEELLNKQVVAVVNFPPKQIGPIMSECLVTGFYDEDGHVILAVPDKPVKNGAVFG
ncbi:MAG: tRNA-binding protein [Gammaproteobacteria bacterium]|nr:MAG: tRNA-binding protein [Gammaproteobacteria bacterium]